MVHSINKVARIWTTTWSIRKRLIDISTTSSNELCLEQLLCDWVKEGNDAKKLIDVFEVLGFHIDARRMSQLLSSFTASMYILRILCAHEGCNMAKVRRHATQYQVF